MKMALNFRWFVNEKHRGVELLCDLCNDLLQSPEIWYFRSVPEDEYASMAVCTYCAAKWTVEMKEEEE